MKPSIAWTSNLGFLPSWSVKLKAGSCLKVLSNQKIQNEECVKVASVACLMIWGKTEELVSSRNRTLAGPWLELPML